MASFGQRFSRFLVGRGRYLSLLVILVCCLLLYIPFRLVAERTNTVFCGVNDNFYYTAAIFLWPLYVFLLVFLPIFAACALGIPLVVQGFMVLVVPLWVDLSWHLDTAIGALGAGRGGLNETSGPLHGPVNTTEISQLLCWLAFFVAIVLGQVSGRFLRIKLKAGELSPKKAEKKRRSKLSVIAMHVSTCGILVPIYVTAAVSVLGVTPPARYSTWSGLLALLGSAYVLSTMLSIKHIRKRTQTRDPTACALPSLIAFATLSVLWPVYLSLPWYGIAPTAFMKMTLIPFYSGVTLLFWLFTRRGLQSMEKQPSRD